MLLPNLSLKPSDFVCDVFVFSQAGVPESMESESSEGDLPRSEQQMPTKSKSSSAAHIQEAEICTLHTREDSDDLNLKKLASLTVSRPRPSAHQVVDFNDELWLVKLKDLSRACKHPT